MPANFEEFCNTQTNQQNIYYKTMLFKQYSCYLNYETLEISDRLNLYKRPNYFAKIYINTDLDILEQKINNYF